MKTDYAILYATGHRTECSIEFPVAPSYGEIEALLKTILYNEPFEHVTVLYEGEARDMFIPEMGHCALVDRPPLPINAVATAIYRTARLTRDHGVDPNSLPQIAGTAVLFHRPVWT